MKKDWIALAVLTVIAACCKFLKHFCLLLFISMSVSKLFKLGMFLFLIVEKLEGFRGTKRFTTGKHFYELNLTSSTISF